MATFQIGIFSVTITNAVASQGTVNRTSPAFAVAGASNVILGLSLQDQYGNLVSGSYTVKVKAGEWFEDVVDFVDGIATITFGVTIAGIYTDIPVEVTVP